MLGGGDPMADRGVTLLFLPCGVIFSTSGDTESCPALSLNVGKGTTDIRRVDILEGNILEV